MKNNTQLIYLTIFLILFVTCIFNIAELNLIAKSDYTNHLEQSVVMNASYLLLCKLIIQSVITYVVGNILYHKVKDSILERDLQKSMDNISVDKVKNRVISQLFKDEVINTEPDISTLQFDPIDAVDRYDKFGIDHNNTMDIKRDRNGRIKSVEKKVEGRLLSDILEGVNIQYTSFAERDVRENSKYIEVEYKTIDMINNQDGTYRYFKMVV
jgi:hypothetical protein